MSELQLKPLDGAQLGRVYRDEMKAVFPANELKPLRVIEKLIKTGRYDALGLFDGAELTGYALMWRAQDGALVLMDYLGIVRAAQGGGYGSKLLTLLRGYYGDGMSVLAEVEAPTARDEAERATQLRRLDFYYRNGFRNAEFDCMLYGVHYTLLVSGEGTREALLTGYERLYRENSPEPLFKKYVRLPYEAEGEARDEHSGD